MLDSVFAVSRSTLLQVRISVVCLVVSLLANFVLSYPFFFADVLPIGSLSVAERATSVPFVLFHCLLMLSELSCVSLLTAQLHKRGFRTDVAGYVLMAFIFLELLLFFMPDAGGANGFFIRLRNVLSPMCTLGSFVAALVVSFSLFRKTAGRLKRFGVYCLLGLVLVPLSSLVPIFSIPMGVYSFQFLFPICLRLVVFLFLSVTFRRVFERE